jgi:hypothetical protein
MASARRDGLTSAVLKSADIFVAGFDHLSDVAPDSLCGGAGSRLRNTQEGL